MYLHNVVRALSGLPPEVRPELSLLAPLGMDLDVYSELGACRPPVRRYSWRVASRVRTRVHLAVRTLRRGGWPQSLATLARRAGADVIFPSQRSLGPSFPVPWIGWIPDFQHRRLPGLFTDEDRARRDQVFEELVRDAPHMVVSSRAALDDLTEFCRPRPDSVSVLTFRTVLDPGWFEMDARAVATSFGLPEKFLIFPAQLWQHKNHGAVFEALGSLRRRGFGEVPLVCTGHMDDYRNPGHRAQLEERLHRCGIEGAVHMLGLQPRPLQIQLMRAAAAVVQPSLFEGWSALVEDARALGKPLFVSDIPVHREQDPSGAMFFDPTRPDQLANRIAEQWPALIPGPDPNREREARTLQRERVLDFGLRFLRLVERATRQAL